MSELAKWLLGTGGKIATPAALDLFLRANNINVPLLDLWIPPVAVPVIIANGPGQAGIINWYDRNPLTVVQSEFKQGQIPPGPGGALSYTVPASRKFMVQSLHMSLTRITVAAPVGLVQQFWRVNGTFILYNELITNGVGDFRSEAAMGTMMLCEGDVLTNLWQDNSTGGTINYMFCFEGIEFDG